MTSTDDSEGRTQSGHPSLVRRLGSATKLFFIELFFLQSAPSGFDFCRKGVAEVWYNGFATIFYFYVGTEVILLGLGFFVVRIAVIPFLWWHFYKISAGIERKGAKWFLVHIVCVAYAWIFVYAYLYRWFGVVDTDLQVGSLILHDPATCLYFSVVTWTTLGYGDFRPVPALRLVAASEALLGYIVMAILIAVFAHMLRIVVQPNNC